MSLVRLAERATGDAKAATRASLGRSRGDPAGIVQSGAT